MIFGTCPRFLRRFVNQRLPLLTALTHALHAYAPHYVNFLHQHLPTQQHNIASYLWQGEQLWLIKAGARNGKWGYRLLGALAWGARLPVLRPVPNLGGSAAIATEARRLHDLAARGLRVPAVLAVLPGGLLISHLGEPGAPTPSLADEIESAVPRGSAPVLALWTQGLQALEHVHASGTSLSQAFARNLVRGPDGVVGYIDFEDDPTLALPLAHCQARDVLCFVHSTALYLQDSSTITAARKLLAQWLAQSSPALQSTLHDSVARMAWLRRLPASRRWGRDLQRARAAHDVLLQLQQL